MDSHDLFKRLTTNLAFTSKKTFSKVSFFNIFNIQKIYFYFFQKNEITSLFLKEEKLETKENEPKNINGKRKIEAADDDADEEEITILGNITSKNLNPKLSNKNSKKQKTVKKLHQIHAENVRSLFKLS